MTLKIRWLHEAENCLGTWLHEADDWQKSSVFEKGIRKSSHVTLVRRARALTSDSVSHQIRVC